MAKVGNFEFSIGADPEIFIKARGSVVPLSAYGKVPGTKERPHPVDRGAVQVDGMALEFNIDPSEAWPTFNANLTRVMNQLQDMVPGYEFFHSPVAHFGKEVIEAQPDEAKVLGCDPDFSAYTGGPNPRPDASGDFRTASGHVHIGWDKGVDPYNAEHIKSCRVLCKALDIYLGLPSIFFAQALNKWENFGVDPEDDKLRRSLYGKAGAYRPKSYGVEYRTLSNLWLHHPALRKLVYYNTLEAIKRCFDDDEWMKYDEEKVQEAINNSDQTLALSIMKYHEVPTPKTYM